MKTKTQKIDKKQIRNILTIRYNPEQTTIFPELKWKSLSDKITDENGQTTQKLLEKSLQESVPKKSKSINVSLSSGIDSSLTLSLLRRIFPDKKIIAICGVFKDGFDESKQAEKIAQKFEADFKIVHMESVFTFMPKIISITGKPKWNTYNHLISREAKKHSNLLITGDGADEVFGGYSFRYNKFLNLLEPSDNWKTKTRKYLDCHNRDWVPDQNKMFGQLIKFDWEDIYDYFKSTFLSPLSPLNQVLLADFNGKLLYDFIPTGKAISEYHNISIVSPFLNQEMINHGTKLDMSQKYDPKSQKGKLVLRKITKRLDIKHIDNKVGFSPSILYDWKEHGKNICTKYILKKDSYIFQKKLINYDWVLQAVEKIESDGDIRYLNRLISILALEIWYRIFISKDLNPSKILS